MAATTQWTSGLCSQAYAGGYSTSATATTYRPQGACNSTMNSGFGVHLVSAYTWGGPGCNSGNIYLSHGSHYTSFPGVTQNFNNGVNH
jgi:hypothetical protein